MSRWFNDTLLPNGAESLADDWQSEAIHLQFLNQYSIQLVFTGTPTGSWYLETSDDQREPTNWSVLTGSSQAITEAGNHTWHVRSAAYTWLRVRYQRASGSGSLTVANITGKGI